MNEPDAVLGIDIGGVETLVFITHPYDGDGWTCLSWSDMLGYGETAPVACYKYPKLDRSVVARLVALYKSEYYVNRDIIPVDALEHSHNEIRRQRAMQWTSEFEVIS